MTAGGEAAALHRDLAPELGLPSWMRVQVLDGPGDLAVTAGLWTEGALKAALEVRDRTALALAGGSTPRGLYRVLSGPFRWRVDWERLHVFQGDERCVPPTDPASNYRMARDELLSRVPVEEGRVHRMEGELAPAEAARRYGAELTEVLGHPPRLDLVLLGLGDDGHTASLFPATFDGHEGDAAYDPHPGRPVAATEAPAEPRRRLTLTLSTLAAARRVLFLVQGEGKAKAVARTFEALRAMEAGRTPEGPIPPAAWVRPAVPAGGTDGDEGTVRWLLDRAAFALAGFDLEGGGAGGAAYGSHDDDDSGHGRGGDA